MDSDDENDHVDGSYTR